MKLFDLRDVFIAVGAVIFFLLFVPIFTYIYFAKDIDSREKIMNLKDTGVVLLDDQSKPFFTFYSAKYAIYVALDQVPDRAREAVIASEDRSFYTNPGFSPVAILRSMIDDIGQKNLAFGGSTITQQLVKNALLTTNKNFLRKYQEVVLASELNRRYSKDQILEMYLNSVYFGQGAFGIQNAAKTYFNKDAKDLDLAQSALLAALLPAPSEFNPVSGNAALAKIHQKIVLEKMYEQHYISAKELQDALEEDPKVIASNPVTNVVAPHFAVMVRDELIQKYGEETIARSGYKVHTSINLDWQSYAEVVVKDQVAKLRVDDVTNGAAVVLDPNSGYIKAFVGSVDWNNSSFGKVSIPLSSRQPGSSFKPIVYSAGLEQDLVTPATILQDQPTTFNQCLGTPYPNAPGCIYKPMDYDRKFRGFVTVRRSLANSLNVPSVEVMSKVGVPTTLEMAHRLGITTLNEDPSNYGLSLVLGAGEVRLVDLTVVYATFANQGKKVNPISIVSVEDKYGNTIFTQPPPDNQQVLDPGVAFQIWSILSDSKTRAEEFGNVLNISRKAAVKTGTTESFRDAWTMGFTPQLAVGVWVGNNDNRQMDQIAGSLGAAPIWKALMEKFLENQPILSYSAPDDITSAVICLGGIKEASSSALTEYFLKGTQPQSTCVSSPVATSSAFGVSSSTGSAYSTSTIVLSTAPEQERKKKDTSR